MSARPAGFLNFAQNSVMKEAQGSMMKGCQMNIKED